MAVIKSSLFHVVKRFPDRKDTIQQLYKKNENFQNICDNYQLCAEALGRWNQSTAEEATARGNEYAELLQDLESEILQTLKECAS